MHQESQMTGNDNNIHSAPQRG